MLALHLVGGERVEVVRARSFADLRPLRMTAGAGTVQRVLCGGAGVSVESFISHPFRKEREKDGAPRGTQGHEA